MNSNTPTTADALFKKVLEIFPEAIIDENLDGEIVIFTNLAVDMNSEDERIVQFKIKCSSDF